MARRYKTTFVRIFQRVIVVTLISGGKSVCLHFEFLSLSDSCKFFSEELNKHYVPNDGVKSRVTYGHIFLTSQGEIF